MLYMALSSFVMVMSMGVIFSHMKVNSWSQKTAWDFTESLAIPLLTMALVSPFAVSLSNIEQAQSIDGLSSLSLGLQWAGLLASNGFLLFSCDEPGSLPVVFGTAALLWPHYCSRSSLPIVSGLFRATTSRWCPPFNTAKMKTVLWIARAKPCSFIMSGEGLQSGVVRPVWC